MFSNSPDEHVKHLNKLFSRLKNFGVIVNPSKSQFGLSKLQFLGHVVTANGIKPLPSKVEVIQKYPLPKDVKQLCTYLGLINFYHRFVQNLAFYLAPLNKYLKKEGNKNSREITWTEETKAAFQKSKDLLAESALLVYPSENWKLSI